MIRTCGIRGFEHNNDKPEIGGEKIRFHQTSTCKNTQNTHANCGRRQKKNQQLQKRSVSAMNSGLGSQAGSKDPCPRNRVKKAKAFLQAFSEGITTRSSRRTKNSGASQREKSARDGSTEKTQSDVPEKTASKGLSGTSRDSDPWQDREQYLKRRG